MDLILGLEMWVGGLSWNRRRGQRVSASKGAVMEADAGEACNYKSRTAGSLRWPRKA